MQSKKKEKNNAVKKKKKNLSHFLHWNVRNDFLINSHSFSPIILSLLFLMKLVIRD